MLKAIASEDVDAAVRLLAEGFPGREVASWETVLARLAALGGNAAADVPPGYLLVDGDRPCGVVLTPARLAQRADGGEGRIVNLSSWYVEPAQRWRAPMMLKSVLARHDAMFTDLTPTDEVRRMLPAFGFEPLNAGVGISLLPQAAILPGDGGRLLAWKEAAAAGVPEATRAAIDRHLPFGGIAVVLLAADGTASAALVRRRAFNRIPGVKLIYADDTAAVMANIGALARTLLSRGCLLLVSDHAGSPAHAGQVLRTRGLKFARPGGGMVPNPRRTDHLWSELCLIDF